MTTRYLNMTGSGRMTVTEADALEQLASLVGDATAEHAGIPVKSAHSAMKKIADARRHAINRPKGKR